MSFMLKRPLHKLPSFRMIATANEGLLMATAREGLWNLGGGGGGKGLAAGTLAGRMSSAVSCSGLAGLDSAPFDAGGAAAPTTFGDAWLDPESAEDGAEAGGSSAGDDVGSFWWCGTGSAA